VPIFFSGFWSKDEILHAALSWPASKGPLVLGIAGALLTAFYMTRQMLHVFAGHPRGAFASGHGSGDQAPHAVHSPHESPAVMTVPLVLLAAGALLLSGLGTPAWPWFASFLEGKPLQLDFGALFHGATLGLIVLSAILVAAGFGAGWKLYSAADLHETATDPLEARWPRLFKAMRGRFFVDELYEATVIAWQRALAGLAAWMEVWVVGGLVRLTGGLTRLLAWIGKQADEGFVNFGFEKACEGVKRLGLGAGALQNGDTQRYLRWLGLTLVFLIVILAWGGGPR